MGMGIAQVVDPEERGHHRAGIRLTERLLQQLFQAFKVPSLSFAVSPAGPRSASILSRSMSRRLSSLASKRRPSGSIALNRWVRRGSVVIKSWRRSRALFTEQRRQPER